MSDVEPKLGRPSSYDPGIAEEVCRRISEGQTLREIGRSEGMPSATSIRRWYLDDVQGFSAQYARAKELQAEVWADDIVDISDDGSNDWQTRQTHNGGVETVLDHEHVTRSRLRVDSRKWLLSKLRPGTYGDKLQHANAAGDGNTEVVYRWADPPKAE